MYSQKSGLYRSLEFDGATYDAIFNEELQWLMMEGKRSWRASKCPSLSTNLAASWFAQLRESLPHLSAVPN